MHSHSYYSNTCIICTELQCNAFKLYKFYAWINSRDIDRERYRKPHPLTIMIIYFDF